MNWSLENNGKSPSVIEDFDLDLFSSEEQWTGHVTNGSRRYELITELVLAGEVDPFILFGFTPSLTNALPQKQDWHEYRRHMKNVALRSSISSPSTEHSQAGETLTNTAD